MLNKRPIVTFLAAALAFAAGCGEPHVQSSNPTPNAGNSTDYATPVPQPEPEQRIFVAALSGSDENTGLDAAKPMKSINAAIARAQAEGLHDVYLLSDGGLEGIYSEIVFVRSGIHLHGGYCFGSGTEPTHDPVTCPALISGGSPSVIASRIDADTIIEDVKIVGKPAVQTYEQWDDDFFMVPELGCMGRGIIDESLAAPCTPEPDEMGRSVPQSSVAVVVVASQGLKMQRVTIESKEGGSGLAGDVGADGSDGADGNDGSSGDLATTPGIGGSASASSCEDPHAQGGRGGDGGRFYWDGTWECRTLNAADPPVPPNKGACPSGYSLVKSLDFTTAYRGFDGDAASGQVSVGRGASFEIAERGGNGEDGERGPDGAAGLEGLPGTSTFIDPVRLTSESGMPGEDGQAGHGGAGGGGGAPAIRTHYKATVVSFKKLWSANLVAGLVEGENSSGSTAEEDIVHQYGETAGAGAGAGAGGGCGGQGGSGGQGAGGSIAIYAVDSNLTVFASRVVTGAGGVGGEGGAGGLGGFGGQGGSGGTGGYRASTEVSGSWSDEMQIGGAVGFGFARWELDKAASASKTEGWSASQAGAGGNGGNGGVGGTGGAGGSGAGGWSIGVLEVGATNTVTESTTFELGEPGTAGSGAADGLQKERYSIQDL